MTMTKRRQGFTLIEVLLVTAITITLGVVSTAFYSRFYAQSAVAEFSDQFVSQIRKAQLYSMASRRNTQWGVRYQSNLLTLFSGSSYAGRNTALDEHITIPSNINVSGLTEIVFSRIEGTPSATATITLSSQTQESVITINALGTVSKQ